MKRIVKPASTPKYLVFEGHFKMAGTLTKRIEDAQARIVSLRDSLDEHLKTINDENPDDASTAITDELTSKIDAQEKALEALKRAEVQLARSSDRANNQVVIHRDRERDREENDDNNNPIVVRGRQLPVFPEIKQKIRPADYIYKAIAVDIMSFGEKRSRPVLDVLKDAYGENEIVRTVMARMITKAAAIPADTTTSGWADTLVQTVIGDFIQSLMPMSVYPGLAARGGSFTYGRNGVISLPARNTSSTVAGAFIAQGAPIPVRQGAFTPITLTPKKMGVITTMTREITEHSTPAIEAIIRQAMQEDTSVSIDTVLLDANAATVIRPAGLKSGVSKTTASVTASIVGFVADLKALASALIVGTKGNLRAPVWIMNPSDVLAGTLVQTTVGETPFREELSRGSLLGYPVIQSSTLAARGMLLVDAADFITATGDTPNFSVSDQAVLHMEDTTPAQITTGGGTPAFSSPVRSLWQTDSMAIRMILDINWAMRRTGCVAWTDTMVW